MSILDDMGKTNKVQYTPKALSMTMVREVIESLMYRGETRRNVVLYTGLGGMWTFDYIIADQSGLLSPHMKKQHARFTRLLGMGLHKAVDENGIVWMIGRVKGKGYYFSNMQQKTSPKRTKNTRFIYFEHMLSKGWPTVSLMPGLEEQYAHYLQKHKEILEAKRTGIRRKGTWTPEQGAMYRGE